jgi:hypothetical protein
MTEQITFDRCTGCFYLNLPRFQKRKLIAELRGNLLIIRKRVAEHTYRFYDSIGANIELLNRFSHLFTSIKIIYGEKTFFVSTGYFLNCGKYVHFEGWDAQRHLTIKQLEDFPMWQESHNIQEPVQSQLNLF